MHGSFCTLAVLGYTGIMIALVGLALKDRLHPRHPVRGMMHVPSKLTIIERPLGIIFGVILLALGVVCMTSGSPTRDGLGAGLAVIGVAEVLIAALWRA